jgi:threonine-phosphate decarboxylase
MAITHGGDVFAVAREHGWNWRDVLDFSASINPLGAAPGVKQAILEAVDRIGNYPEREPVRLRAAVAHAWNVGEDQVLLGNGATELIFFVSRLITGLPVTLALPVFSEFHRAFRQAQTADLNNSATWPREGLLVLTRPANPTGWTLPLDCLKRYLESTNNPVLVDESFLEFSGFPSASTLLPQYPQLMILRSLTKFHALPGLRIGALVGSPAAVRAWREQREPWQVNVLAEEAALASLADSDHAAQSLEFVRVERAWLLERLGTIRGAEPIGSDANFLYVPTRYPAQPLCDFLLRRRILIRNCTGWPGLSGEAVRVAVRQRHENERLLQAWREFTCE